MAEASKECLGEEEEEESKRGERGAKD